MCDLLKVTRKGIDFIVYIVYMQHGTNLPSRHSEGHWSGQPSMASHDATLTADLHVAKTFH